MAPFVFADKKEDVHLDELLVYLFTFINNNFMNLLNVGLFDIFLSTILNPISVIFYNG